MSDTGTTADEEYEYPYPSFRATRPTEDRVREFHEAFGFHVEDTPTVPPDHIRVERARLIAEEAAEVVAELLAGLPDREQMFLDIVDIFGPKAWPPRRPLDLAKLLREHADLEYVNNGGAVNAGLPLVAAVVEVHRANMAKLDADGQPIVDEHGKAQRPAGWEPPDIAAVLAAAATSGSAA